MDLHVQQATQVETIGSITVAHNGQLDASLHKLIESFEPPPRHDGHVCAGAFGVIQPEDTSLLQIVVNNDYSQLVTPLQGCFLSAAGLPEALRREWDAYVSAVRDSEAAIERGRAHLSSLGLTPTAESPDIIDERPTWNLLSYTTYFQDYQAFGERIGIVTDDRGVPIKIGAGLDDPHTLEWEHLIVGSVACDSFVRQSLAGDSAEARQARESEAQARVLGHIAEYAEAHHSLAAWAQAEAPDVAVTSTDLDVLLHDLEGAPLITLHYSSYAGEGWAKLGNANRFSELEDILTSTDFPRIVHAIGATPKAVTNYLDSLSRSMPLFHRKALGAPGAHTVVSAAHEAREAQALANLKSQRETIPSDVLGGRPTYATAQGALSKPMRWAPPAPLHRTEGRSL